MKAMQVKALPLEVRRMKITMALLLTTFSLPVLAEQLVLPVTKTALTQTATAETVKPASATPPVIVDAWISEAPPVAKNNAAYITLKNGNRKDALLGVETPAAAKAELHQMSMAGGIMRMQRLPLINLAANQTLSFAPGGRHIMLIGMRQALKVGDKVPLVLIFRKAGRITVQADVRMLRVNDESSAAADKNSGHMHHH